MLLVILFFLLLPHNVGWAVDAQSADSHHIHYFEENKQQEKAVGEMLVIGSIAEPSNFLPFMASDSASREIAGYFFVAPLRYDQNLEVVPFAAKKFEVLEDGLLLRFTLAKGIYWSDGVELTAEDVEYTYQLMIDDATPTSYAGDFKIIQSFTVRDRYSFEVRYEKPFPRALSTWMSPIMPKHALKGLRGQDLRTSPLLRQPLSCGPYLLDTWKPGASIRLKANPNYFEGKPAIDYILYRFIPDATTMFLELKAGTIDFVGSLTPQQYLYQTNTDQFKENFNVYHWLGAAYTFLGYNLESPLFKDVRIRQAMAHAINKADIVKGALFGQGVSTVGPFSPTSWAYNKAIQDYDYNPQKALKLFEAAGWKQNKQGILEKDGLPFSFTLLVNQGNEPRIKTAVLIQYQLKKIGIDVKIRTVEWAAFLKNFVDKGFFDALILGWTLPAEPDCFDVWHSSRIGGLNFIHYSNEEADDLLVRARSTFDRDARKKMYDRFQEILHEEQPYCFLFVPYTFSAVHKRVKGIQPAPAGIGYNQNDWWIPSTEQRYFMDIQ